MLFLACKRTLVNSVISFAILYQPWLIDSRSLSNINTPSGLHNYLKSYGYIADDTEVSAESNKQAIIKYQRYFGLPETGILDEETKRFMEKPRCGSPDIKPVSYSIAPKQYLAKHIRWKLNQTHELVPFLDAKRIISQSVEEWLQWMDVLTISESQNPNSEILIDFVRPDIYGNHGDERPFGEDDLAHAYFPDNLAIASDIHINMMKPFAPYEPPGPQEHSLKWVIMHELGHSLGMGHAILKSSVMYPIIPKGSAYPGLSQDDIYGIKEMYGACRTRQCKNGGTCIALARAPGSICVCPPTHTGLHCEKECSNYYRSNTLCKLWAGRGECLVNQEWMEKQCFKACTKCHIPKCVNLHSDYEECAIWARDGECYSEWMKTYCYRSCSKCDVSHNQKCSSKIIDP